MEYKTLKFKNVKVGQTVKVKKSNSTEGQFYNEHTGKTGIVKGVDYFCDRNSLTILVEFEDGDTDWGNHKDLKLVEDVEA